MEVYTLQEVSVHDHASSCWIAIDGYVYDVTSYLVRELHPGGNEVLLKYAGKDATSNFKEIHSNEAWKMLDAYCIGKLHPTRYEQQASYLDRVKQFFRLFY